MKNATKRLFTMLLCAVVLITMAACGRSADGEGENETSKTPTATTAPDGSYSVTLPDKTVLEFSGTPKRIVSMGPNITDILFELGVG